MFEFNNYAEALESINQSRAELEKKISDFIGKEIGNFEKETGLEVRLCTSLYLFITGGIKDSQVSIEFASDRGKP